MGELSKNIILIGMPDSEKITIGKIVSKKLGFKFINADQCIEVPHILTECECSVISTEAEVIKSHPDIKELRKNGVVIFIDNKNQLKDEKHKIHRKCCDLHLIKDNNIDEIAFYICSLF
jgi:shikimate kinase